MKKQLIIIVSLFTAAVAAIAILSYVLSYHKVVVTLKAIDMTGSIFQYEDGRAPLKIMTIDTTRSIKLQDGKYGYVPENAKYDSTPILFEISGKDSSVEIDPSYSHQRLATLLQDELLKITSVITMAYGQLLEPYDIKPGSLYKKGEWYSSTIIEHAGPGGNYGDTYRIVLHKVDGAWQIAAKPSLVLTTHDNPTIPKDVLTSVNDL